ncbi:MAG TPA: universal stress protein [Mycobacterium sp.]|nr:universal stress protein [Mycobacterium sp.]
MRSERTQSTLVVCVDGSGPSDAAVRWAVGESVMRERPITLIHVVAPTPIDSTMAPDGAIPQVRLDQARQIVQHSREIADELTDGKHPRMQTEITYASVVSTFIEASQHAYMMVTGSRGVDASSAYRLGSVSAALLRDARCPVAVVHDRQHVGQNVADASPVLLGIDGTPASEAATALAFDEASRRQVPLLALHAWSDVGVFPILGMDWHVNRDQGDEVLGERLAGWHERYPDVQVERKLVCDVPARWLVQESTRAQLVVLGRRGRGGYPGMRLGSVSSAVAQSARVPVIVVPDDQPWD